MTTRTRLSALLLASSFVLVGCGSGSGSDEGGDSARISDLSADKLLTAATKQVADEEFVAIKGKGVDEDAGTNLVVDLGFSGDTASGTMTVDGLELELLKAEGSAYFKAGDEFYEANAGEGAEKLISLIGDRWVYAAENDPKFGELASFVDKPKFFKQLLEPDGKVTKGDDKTVNGVDCVALTSDGDTFYFDKADGKPISLDTKGDGTGTLNFTYDEIPAAEAPAKDEVIDLSKIVP